MLPGFRPDKALGIELPGFAEYIKKLGESAGVEIKSYKDVISALLARIDFFNAAGCRVSDHAFSYMPYVQDSEEQIEVSFERAMSGEKYRSVMQMHIKPPLCRLSAKISFTRLGYGNSYRRNAK